MFYVISAVLHEETVSVSQDYARLHKQKLESYCISNTSGEMETYSKDTQSIYTTLTYTRNVHACMQSCPAHTTGARDRVYSRQRLAHA